MDSAQALIGVIGVTATIVTFCLLRFPRVRRPPFRHYGACSLWLSLAGAALVLALTVLMMLAQGAWHQAGHAGPPLKSSLNYADSMNMVAGPPMSP